MIGEIYNMPFKYACLCMFVWAAGARPCCTNQWFSRSMILSIVVIWVIEAGSVLLQSMDWAIPDFSHLTAWTPFFVPLKIRIARTNVRLCLHSFYLYLIIYRLCYYSVWLPVRHHTGFSEPIWNGLQLTFFYGSR